MFLVLIMVWGLGGVPKQEFALNGLPVQIEWRDLQHDGRMDLLAVVLRSETVGSFTTFYEAGGLRGMYEDSSQNLFIFQSWIQTDHGFEELAPQELGAQFHGISYLDDQVWVWGQDQKLLCFQFEQGAWLPQASVTGPLDMDFSGQGFAFIWKRKAIGDWMVPGLHSLNLVPLDGGRPRAFTYPDHMVASWERSSYSEVMSLPLPKVMDFDSDGLSDLVWVSQPSLWVLPGKEGETVEVDLPGTGFLKDLDSDGWFEWVQVETNDEDIQKLKDLKKMKSHLSIYRYSEKKGFNSEPVQKQTLPGVILPADDDLTLLNPFLDLNSDGLIDIASFGFKLSYLQVARVAATGKMNMKFLLELHLQRPDGTFHTLPNGPFEMKWTFNVRALRMPEFGQLVADFNADGWSDLLWPTSRTVNIHTVSNRGISRRPSSKIRIPKSYRDPDQIMARDVIGDARAELILLKMRHKKASLALLEGDL